MTTSRLFPATSGPATPAAYSGNFLCGVIFKVTSGGMWFTGYYHWVPGTSGDTVARKFCLWQIRGAGSGVLIPAATVTSGTLTAGQWNFVSLGTPVPLAIGTAYNACTGWSAVHGFPDSDTAGSGTGAGDSFGTGGHTTGITQGPLFAFSDLAGTGGTKPEPYGTSQGVFSTAGTDPAVIMPASGSSSANFWMDVQVSDTGPAGYSGPYRLWPGKTDTNSSTVPDAAVDYDIATEFALSASCAVGKIWYYSPSGTAQLATAANIWAITGGGLTGTLAATVASPSWSGAAGSGWISCPVTGVTLASGSYKVSVYNSAATPDQWSAKDANTDYWRAGEGANGITWGPLSAPKLSSAGLAYNYNGSLGGSTPPFTDGTTQAGQPTFTQGPPDRYPYLFAAVPSPTAGSTQNYWVDIEVSAAALAPAGAATAAAAAPAPAVTTGRAPLAGAAAGTGTAPAAAQAIASRAGTAAAAGTVPLTGFAAATDITVAAGPTTSPVAAGPLASRAQVSQAGLTAGDGKTAGLVTDDGTRPGPTTVNRSS